ncbi:MAG: NnrS family protein [Oligoflexia bacterium]|nr:NnrS family protein [Oligoflexia bacterium]
MIEKYCKDPFKLFFPVALLCLLYGAMLWVFHSLLDIGEFPLERHANIFFGGYLFFSIMGFLLTAIPQFTKSQPLSKNELFLSVLTMILILCNYFLESNYFWHSLSFGLTLLGIFIISRIKYRKENPPYAFIFVLLGIIIGLTGTILIGLNINEALGKTLFFDGMVNSFIIGIGTRLIPGILGFKDIVKQQRAVYENANSFLKSIPSHFFFLIIIFLLSLLYEYKEVRIGYILRASVFTFIAIKYWSIHKSVPSKKWHGRMIKLSTIMLLVASWLLYFFPDHILSIKHLIYIGTYVLLTLLISSRVILAHAGLGLCHEEKKNPFLIVSGIILFAAVTRATAHLIPDSYTNHLGYAGFLISFATIWYLINPISWLLLKSRNKR